MAEFDFSKANPQELEELLKQYSQAQNPQSAASVQPPSDITKGLASLSQGNNQLVSDINPPDAPPPPEMHNNYIPELKDLYNQLKTPAISPEKQKMMQLQAILSQVFKPGAPRAFHGAYGDVAMGGGESPEEYDKSSEMLQKQLIAPETMQREQLIERYKTLKDLQNEDITNQYKTAEINKFHEDERNKKIKADEQAALVDKNNPRSKQETQRVASLLMNYSNVAENRGPEFRQDALDYRREAEKLLGTYNPQDPKWASDKHKDANYIPQQISGLEAQEKLKDLEKGGSLISSLEAGKNQHGMVIVANKNATTNEDKLAEMIRQFEERQKAAAEHQSGKQAVNDEKMLIALGKGLNAATASSKNGVGVAFNVLQKGKRLIDLFDDPTIDKTKQVLNISAADIASMVSGGAPTMSASDHATMSSLGTTLGDIVQRFSGKTINSIPQKFQDQMKKIAEDMMETSQKALDDNGSVLFNSYLPVIHRNPEQVKKMLKAAGVRIDSDTGEVQKNKHTKPDQPDTNNQQEDPNIRKFANDHVGGDYQKALAIINARKAANGK